MIKSILNTHRNMMYEFMEVTGLDDYGLAWFCFMKGVIFASINCMDFLNEKMFFE